LTVAKKVRTPPPRPRQQGPRRRDSRPPRGQFRPLGLNKRGLLAGMGAGAAVGVIIVVLLLTGGKKNSTPSVSVAQAARALAAAGCTLRSVKPLPPKDGKNYHDDSPSLNSDVKWSTFPPSGGGHYPAWAVWGFYREPVNPRQVVHNLEHGAVVIWWGPQVPSATVDKLEQFYNQSPDGMFGTPIAGLGKKIALTAWTGDPRKYYRNGYYGIGRLAICSQFDQKAFAAFRGAFKGQGPEGIPLSADKPGMGPG
jgi:Protein of unknown function (DUF3105)